MSLARIAGFVAAAIIFAVWFWMIGTRPVLETLGGVILAGIAGYSAYDWVRKRFGPDARPRKSKRRSDGNDGNDGNDGSDGGPDRA